MPDLIEDLEQVLVMDCHGESLCGILHDVPQPAETGVILIVGGPQYRVGSHRQFLLLARQLACNGIPVLRFDYRGMGDSEGSMRDFEHIHEDIGAALDVMLARYPAVTQWALWGLCDAATAASFYAAQDSRVAGLVLLNPWVRTEAGQSKTYLKYYYWQRLCSRDFWKKLVSGKMAWLQSIHALGQNVGQAYAPGVSVQQSSGPLPDRLLAALQAYQGRLMFILSGNDLTAREFEQTVSQSMAWRELMQADRLQMCHIPDADHTFSRRIWRDQVAEITTQWLNLR